MVVANSKRKALSKTSVHAAPLEWRWLIGLGAVFIVVISLPLMWALWTDMQQPDVSFMGLLTNPLDGATYISKIQLGKEGYWRTIFRHSPGVEQGAYITLVYNGLGRLSRYLGLSNTFTYHAGRLLASFLMFAAIYQLGSVIWRRQRTRRMFFILAVLGSGLGWLMVFFGIESPDLVIPEAFPLYSAATNVQFPLALALLALAVSVMVTVFRPGFDEEPTIRNGGLTLLLCSLGLALVAPHALVPFTMALGLTLVVDWRQKRKITDEKLRWLALVLVMAAPVAGYYTAEIYYNDAVAAWTAQNITLTPPPWVYLAGFGVPLVLAAPGIYRAVRHFEPDGDRFMLLWLVSILVMVYVPVSAQRRFSMGLMLPIAYFAVRGLTDFWLVNRSDVWRGRFVAAVYGVAGLSYGLLLVLWFRGATSVNDFRFYLDTDYMTAFAWLGDEVDHGTVVLASESVGLWLPGYAGMSVVYGHPYESLNAAYTRRQVQNWFNADSPDDAVCDNVMLTYDVRYVLVGNHERGADGAQPACAENLTPVQTFGDVVLYAP